MTDTVNQRSKKGRINERDKHIASKILEARTQKNISQKNLAKQLGISHQQLHKYERAQSRIAASRLEALANALNMPVADFYTPHKPSPSRLFLGTLKPHERKFIQTLRTINDPTVTKSITKLLAACLKGKS